MIRSDTASYDEMALLARTVAVIGMTLSTRLHFSDADDTTYGVTGQRSGQIFRGISVPGDFVGTAPQTVPGVALPTQERRFPDKIPFSPTNSVFGNTAAVHNGNSWGYGQAYHGVNPLNLNANNLYDAYADASRPIPRGDGQSFPFDHVFDVGGEYDMQKWKYARGGLKVPVLSQQWPNLFDLNGKIQENGKKKFVDVDMPLPGTNERLPIKANYLPGTLITSYQFGQAIPNVNPFQLSKQEIVDRLSNGQNINPTYVGQ